METVTAQAAASSSHPRVCQSPITASSTTLGRHMARDRWSHTPKVCVCVCVSMHKYIDLCKNEVNSSEKSKEGIQYAWLCFFVVFSLTVSCRLLKNCLGGIQRRPPFEKPEVKGTVSAENVLEWAHIYCNRQTSC